MPDIDIHIIPDTVQVENYRKRHYEMHWKHPSVRDLLLTLFIFTACTMIGLLFEKLHFTDTNVVTLITADDCRELEIMSKADVASAIVSEILKKMC